MTWKDKSAIGLKEDAPFRKDNLPLSEVRGPEIPSGPGYRLIFRWRARLSRLDCISLVSQRASGAHGRRSPTAGGLIPPEIPALVGEQAHEI